MKSLLAQQSGPAEYATSTTTEPLRGMQQDAQRGLPSLENTNLEVKALCSISGYAVIMINALCLAKSYLVHARIQQKGIDTFLPLKDIPFLSCKSVLNKKLAQRKVAAFFLPTLRRLSSEFSFCGERSLRDMTAIKFFKETTFLHSTERWICIDVYKTVLQKNSHNWAAAQQN